MSARIAALTADLKRASREVNVPTRRRVRAMDALAADLHREAAAVLDGHALKFMVKMSKGTKGMVNIALLKKVLGSMKGWSIKDTTVVIHLNGKYTLFWNLLNKYTSEGQKLVRYFGNSLGKKEPFEIVFEKGVNEADAQKFVDSIKRHAKIVTTGPKSGAVGDVFSSKPIAVKMDKWGEHRSEIVNAWAVTPGWTIKSAKGTELTLPHPISDRGRMEDPSGMKLARFWTWGYKNGLKESAVAALAAMDQEELAYQTAPKSKRDLVRRESSEEVRKVLNQLVAKKYSKVLSALTKAATQALSRFMDFHDDYVRGEREKGNEYPRFMVGSYFRSRPGEQFYQSAILRAVEHTDRVSETWKRKKDWKKEMSIWATFMADQAKEQFVYKNDVKLTRIVKGKGNLKATKILSMNDDSFDYGGEIKFTFEDGSLFIVRNKTVWKTSSLGRPFLQFPTTFHNVVLPDGKKMSGVSEKSMLEVFTGVSATGR